MQLNEAMNPKIIGIIKNLFGISDIRDIALKYVGLFSISCSSLMIAEFHLYSNNQIY